jgi:hypothetical protein
MSTGATSVRLPALSQAEFDVLGENVFCDDEIGIDWRVIENLPDESELGRRNLHNEKVLRALALFEEHDQSPSDEAERAELHRLEGKIDLLLELVTVLVRDQQGNNRVRNARFNTRGLCWDSTRQPPKTALIDVDCYLLAQWPLPLKLSARIVDVAPAREGAQRVCSRIEGLSGPCRDWLGKLVFRRHRRSVALQRARG